jgi:branched-chain amino acid transport system ATP-binding protein
VATVTRFAPAVGLRVAGLSVSYGGVHALDEVELGVEPGAIVGLIGPNGAGKTTAIDAISGFVSARGVVELDGVRLDALPPHRRARAGIVRTFQSLELFSDLSVIDNVAVAALHARWWSPFVDAVRPRHSRHVDVEWALDAVGLLEAKHARADELSHGQRRLVGIARALAGAPRVLLLDEPAAGLDPHETATLADLVRTLSARGIAVLLVDHDMSLVMAVCERVVVLDFGRVIANGPPAAVRAEPAVVHAYLGSSMLGSEGHT